MRSFVPYMLIAFVIYVAIQGQLPAYLTYATKPTWNVNLSTIFGGGKKSSGGGGLPGVSSVLGGGNGGGSPLQEFAALQSIAAVAGG